MAERRFVGHLDASTRIYQTSADAQLVRACASLATYRDYLAKAHGFERGIERAVGGGVGVPREGLVWAKSEAVAADLVALGMRPQEVATLPICEVGEALDRLGPIIGWLFVSGRAANARGMALPELERAQPFARRHASAYLEQAASKKHVDRLIELIEDVTRDHAVGASVIAAAGNAFRSHRGWFLAPLPPRRSSPTVPTVPHTGVHPIAGTGGPDRSS